MHSPAQPSTLSSALARVLEQLNPTAWLPAAVLVGDVALALAYVYEAGKPGDRWVAIATLINGKPWGVLLGTLFSLALVTILTQAVGFAAIRTLEGYWGTSWLASIPARLGIGRQVWKQNHLFKLADTLDRRALVSAVPAIKVVFANQPLVATAIDWRVNGLDVSTIDPAAVAAADAYLDSKEWRVLASAMHNHRITSVERRLEGFPDSDRMMPTRLGLTLRTAEDDLGSPQLDGELRGFVIRNMARIDPILLAEHDEHRNRLDMYAVMTFVALAIVPVNWALLSGDVEPSTLIGFTVGALILAWSSYRGAVASAGEYGQALGAIDRAVTARS